MTYQFVFLGFDINLLNLAGFIRSCVSLSFKVNNSLLLVRKSTFSFNISPLRFNDITNPLRNLLLLNMSNIFDRNPTLQFLSPLFLSLIHLSHLSIVFIDNRGRIPSTISFMKSFLLRSMCYLCWICRLHSL